MAVSTKKKVPPANLIAQITCLIAVVIKDKLLNPENEEKKEAHQKQMLSVFEGDPLNLDEMSEVSKFVDYHEPYDGCVIVDEDDPDGAHILNRRIFKEESKYQVGEDMSITVAILSKKMNHRSLSARVDDCIKSVKKAMAYGMEYMKNSPGDLPSGSKEVDLINYASKKMYDDEATDKQKLMMSPSKQYETHGDSNMAMLPSWFLLCRSF